MFELTRRRIAGAAAVALVGAAAGWALWQRAPADGGLMAGNGRLEAVQVDVAARVSGRVAELLVDLAVAEPAEAVGVERRPRLDEDEQEHPRAQREHRGRDDAEDQLGAPVLGDAGPARDARRGERRGGCRGARAH